MKAEMVMYLRKSSMTPHPAGCHVAKLEKARRTRNS